MATFQRHSATDAKGTLQVRETGSSLDGIAQWRYWACLGVLGVFFVASRLLELGADPPADLASQFITDEGWWAHNARNHFLFGRWATDDFNQALYATPVYTGLLRAAFEVLGLGLWQARVVSVVSGCITLAALIFVLHRSLGRSASLLGGFAFAFDYFSYTHQRVALVEASTTAMLVLSLALATVASPRRPTRFLSGFIAVMAVFTKMNSIFAVPALAVGAFLSTEPLASGAASLRVRLASLRWFTAGATACGLAWLVWFVHPHWNDFLSQNQRLAGEGMLEGLVLLTSGFAIGLDGNHPLTEVWMGGFLTQALLPIGLGLVWLAFLAVRIRRIGVKATIARLTWVEWVAICWVGALFAYLSTHHNAIDRRYYTLVIPLCILGASLLGPAWRDIGAASEGAPRFAARRWVGATVLVAGVSLYLRLPIMRFLEPLVRDVPLGTERGLSLGSLAAISMALLWIVGAPLAALLLDRSTRVRWRAPVAAITVVLVALPALVPRYIANFRDRSYTMRAAEADLERSFGPNARVFGGVANTLLMGTPYRTLFLLDRSWLGYPVFGQKYLESFEPTHVLLYGMRDEPEMSQSLAGVGLPEFEIVPGSTRILQLCRSVERSPRFQVGAAAIRRRSAGIASQ